jgi:hypothetical protein
MDPLALNYDPQAIANDGSCAYALTEFSLNELTLLPEELHEASGIEWLEAGLFIHNDAGNPDRLYKIDSLSGEILQTITIAGADNIDWEDITEDDDFIYLGDFGNNIGNRTDLRIYKIQKEELSNTVVNAEFIEFSYEDQIDFEPGMNDHNFDCEAILSYGNKIHLFTKNWADNKTRHYSLPKSTGTHIAKFVETLDVGGLITGADISTNGEVVLVGYTEFGLNFMWLLFDYQDSLFFSGNKRRIALGSGLNNSQTEGITFRNETYGYICSEKFTINSNISLPQKILSFSIDQWVNPSSTNIDLRYPIDLRIKVFPNPCDSFALIEVPFDVDSWRLIDSLGRVVKVGTVESARSFRFDTSSWSPGVYVFVVQYNNRSSSTRLIKR